MVAAAELRVQDEVSFIRYPHLRVIEIEKKPVEESIGFGEFAQHALILHILERDLPEPSLLTEVEKNLLQRAEARLKYVQSLSPIQTGNKLEDKKFTLRRDKNLLLGLANDFRSIPEFEKAGKEQRTQYQNTLIETVRAYRGFTQLEGTKWMMAQKNVGIDMAVQILEHVEKGSWEWDDLSVTRKKRFAEKPLLLIEPDKTKWPEEWKRHVEAESFKSGGIQGFGEWVIQVDRELYLEIVQHFYPAALSEFIGHGATANDIVSSPKYQKIRQAAEEFMPAMSNPYR